MRIKGPSVKRSCSDAGSTDLSNVSSGCATLLCHSASTGYQLNSASDKASLMESDIRNVASCVYCAADAQSFEGPMSARLVSKHQLPEKFKQGRYPQGCF